MANITAAEVKKLRDLTAAGMMECKRALEETDGDFDKAVEHLRISGAAKAAKDAAAKKAKNIEDKTFGLKNKKKSAKVQK